MPLPVGGYKVPWPPKEMSGIIDMLEEAAAWYGGNPEILATYYATHTDNSPGTRFWRRAAANTRSVAIHLPIAADIAQASAHLLFGEEVEVKVESEATQARLEVLLDKCRFQAKCLEAADIDSGLGSVYVKIDWDKSVAEDHPLLTVVQPDAAIPEFAWGQLVAVTFWRVLPNISNTKNVWRHLEYHTKQGVEHALYRGSEDFLGPRMELSSHPDTEGLADYTPSDDLNVIYVPNFLPNRTYRGMPIGQADTANCIPLMEAADEVITSWVRDVRLGATRLAVPEEYLEVNLDAQQKVVFDLEREIFIPLAYDPAVEGSKMTVFQPPIRNQEHYQTLTELIERVLSVAGFAPQTFGIGKDPSVGNAAVSGVALKVRERKTLMTKARKERYWGPELEFLLYRLQVIDAQYFDSGILPEPVTVSFGDSYAPDALELATVVELWNRGKAASPWEKVAALHQEWDDTQIQKEVDRLKADSAPPVPPPDPTSQNVTLTRTAGMARARQQAMNENSNG